MANYIGLQGVFNALAGGGANAVNIYAQEKDRQRRLAFDEKKFEADQAYKKQVLDQDQQRIDHATRTQDFVENKWQHLQDQERKKGLVDLQTRTAGNARSLALQKGFNNPLEWVKSGDPEALSYYNAGMQNAARYMTNSEIDTELVPTGKDAAGDTVYSIQYKQDGKVKTFGQAGSLEVIAGQLTEFNTEIGIPVFLAENDMAVDYDKDGKAMVVNTGKDGPNLTPQQQQKTAELDQQVQQGSGKTLQQKLDNPITPQIQAELDGQEKGLAYEGMPAGERAKPTPKPRNLKEFYEREFADAKTSMEQGVEAVNNLPHIKAYDQAGGGVKGVVAGTANVVGQAAKDLASVPAEIKRGLRWAGDKVSNAAGFVGEHVAQGYNGEAGTEAPQEVSTDQTTSSDPAPTAPASKPPAQPAKAQEQIVSPKTSPKRRAAIFANQMLAAGGKDAMGSTAAQTIYQELLQGNPDATAAASANLTAGMPGNKKEVDAYAKFWDTVRDQINPHVENHARLMLDGQEGQEGHEQKVKLHQSGIMDTLYAVSTQFKNMGYDVGKLSRHPESYRDMVAVAAKYYDAKRKAIKHNENLGWFGSKRELPNMTNFMLKTISQTAPKTAERMALSMAFEQNPEAESGTIAKEAQALMQQWSTLETFMDEPAE